MRYAELKKGDIFSCKIRDTYTDIYLYYNGKYVNVFSVQKKDYPYILGLGERTGDNSGLIPITLTEETIKFILGKHYGVGFFNSQANLTISPNSSFVITPGIDPNGYKPNPTPTTNEDKEEETKETDPIQLLSYAAVVYVYASSIECELVPEDDVEIEEVEEEAPVIEEKKEKKEKDYSKLIWIALGAAALLL